MKEKILHLLKTKGYYMVLALSVITVGTVSFLSYRATQRQQAETPLNPGSDVQGVDHVENNVPDDRTDPPTEDENNPPAQGNSTPEVAALEYAAPLTGELIAHYSPDQPVYSYTLKDWRTHNGIDIAAPADTQVLNVADGVVESVATDDLMGNLVVVRHTDGKVSRYASLNSMAVTEGQVVAKGDPIGTVGQSMLLECGETAHLHYELWNNDKPTDPSSLMG